MIFVKHPNIIISLIVLQDEVKLDLLQFVRAQDVYLMVE